MWIRVTDLAQNKITLNSDLIAAIIVPSPLAPGDGKSRIIGTGMILEVHRSEAIRVAGELSASLLEAVPES